MVTVCFSSTIRYRALTIWLAAQVLGASGVLAESPVSIIYQSVSFAALEVRAKLLYMTLYVEDRPQTRVDRQDRKCLQQLNAYTKTQNLR